MSRNVDKYKSAIPSRNHRNHLHHGSPWQSTSSNGFDRKVSQWSCCSWCSKIVACKMLHYSLSIFDRVYYLPFFKFYWSPLESPTCAWHVALIQDWMTDPNAVEHDPNRYPISHHANWQELPGCPGLHWRWDVRIAARQGLQGADLATGWFDRRKGMLGFHIIGVS